MHYPSDYGYATKGGGSPFDRDYCLKKALWNCMIIMIA